MWCHIIQYIFRFLFLKTTFSKQLNTYPVVWITCTKALNINGINFIHFYNPTSCCRLGVWRLVCKKIPSQQLSIQLPPTQTPNLTREYSIPGSLLSLNNFSQHLVQKLFFLTVGATQRTSKTITLSNSTPARDVYSARCSLPCGPRTMHQPLATSSSSSYIIGDYANSCGASQTMRPNTRRMWLSYWASGVKTSFSLWRQQQRLRLTTGEDTHSTIHWPPTVTM